MRRFSTFFLWWTVLGTSAGIVASAGVFGQTPNAKPSSAEQQPPGAPVTLNGQTLFYVKGRLFTFSPEDRARTIQQRLVWLSKQPESQIRGLAVVDEGNTSEIVSGDTVVMTVTEGDAAAEGKSRQQVANEYAGLIRSAAENLRKQYSFKTLLLGAVYAGLSTLILLVLLKVIAIASRKTHTKLESWRGVYLRSIRIQKLELLTAERVTGFLRTLTRLARIAVTLLLLYAYVILTLSFFPWTRGYASILFSYILDPLRTVGQSATAYLPSIFFIAVISVVSFYVIRFVRFIFAELRKETISLPGFYPEWANPTYKIVRFLILAFTVVVIFPYLPGSRSPAFQGISIFLGLLFSLGSSSAIANVVAGSVLTYTRAFQVGDRVQIGDAVGDVVEKTLLVTRIRTIKNVDVSIPNAMVLGSHIVNFSSAVSDDGLILHTGVTIGYDAPWRTVHKLLIDAALTTDNILKTPEPFVLQTSLNDFFVSYELNAYTDKPAVMARTYSDLHQNIQDKFNEAGVEIMSPHYSSLRDGNQTTIPQNHRPKDYVAPAFRVFPQDARNSKE